MRKNWLGAIILLLLLTACAPDQGSPIEPPLPQATATPPTNTPTKMNLPLIPTSTPTKTNVPPRPTNTISPSATSTPVELSHPLLTPDLLNPGTHLPYSYLSSSGEEVRYLLFLPEDFDPQLKWPVIVVFHGHGEKGSNINRVLDASLPELQETKGKFPFIVISPQLPSGFWTSYIDPVDELLDHLGVILSIESNRLYLTGYSAGGYGAWRYALRYPGRFAAVAPISGIASLTSGEPVPEDICKLKELPIWVFHGEADTVILAENSIAAVEALESCDGKVKFTLYPDGNHPDGWLNAYTDPVFYDWLLENER